MKIHFNKKIKKIFYLALLAVFILPQTTLAYNDLLSNIIFCKRQLSPLRSRIVGQVTKTFEQDSLKKEDFSTDFDQTLKQRAVDKDQKRDEVDGLIQSYILSIKDRAMNDGDKTAIDEFNKNIKSILEKHRKNTDEIIKEYENNLRDNAIKQQDKIGDLVKGYKVKVEDVFDNMSYKCKSPQKNENYRDILRGGLRYIRNQIIDKEKQGGGLEENVDKILQEKKDKQNFEDATFVIEMEKAYSALNKKLQK